ncbi:MAG: YraN family protein [Spirochaetota bacterium]|nr:YraN family protein [Spirochaetota bacterium]
MKKKELGKFGETIAKKYLIDQGFTFITENYFTRKGEIDLIFQNKNILLFIEVKTRKNKNDFDIAIGFQKMKCLRASAEIFIEKENVSFTEMQFDVIFILLGTTGNVEEIGHKPNFL